MQYGYFDDKRKEYVITNPETPRSWSNYLGSTDYGAIITNNAGGYSFYKSAAQGKFMRFRANTVPMDQPGRYVYIHDKDSKDYWSTSWQPVSKPLKKYKTTCRHGSAYSIIESKYSKIKSETLYFVPLGKEYECWVVKLTNLDTKPRNLRLFTYTEFVGHWIQWMDLVNLQYTQYIVQMDVIDGIIQQCINPFLPVEKGPYKQGQTRPVFMTLVGSPVTGFDTDREKFITPYRSYNNPMVVEKGECTNSIAIGDNGIGTLQTDITLQPGESKDVIVIMGIGEATDEAKKAISEIPNAEAAYNEFEKLRTYWHTNIEGMNVNTPDTEFNSQINMWSPFNCLMTYFWSRAASLVYSGERDGLGYRDTVQDMLGVLPTLSDKIQDRLELMITGQDSKGGAMPVVKPFDHTPGQMPLTPEEEYRSDDCMWLFNTIPAYIKETGKLDFYDQVLPYADHGEATVLGHMKRAIEFSLERSGVHGLPCGLAADWNDCLVLGQKGETVFVAFQLRYALQTYIEICTLKNLTDEVAWADNHIKQLDENIEKYAWDSEWFLRAYREDGFKFGSKESEEGNVWLNPQTWSVISGYAKNERAEQVMNIVGEKLASEYGVVLVAPPYEKTDVNVIKATLFNKGMKENGAVFQHTQGWVVISEALLGRGDLAYQYFRSFMPAAYNTKAEIREIEPYVYAQSTNSKFNPRFGSSRLPWLTGAATWSYFAASQYILGVQPEYNGISINPCVPKDWKKFSVTRRFRGKILNIKVKNNDLVNKGVKYITVNGTKIKGNFIPLEQLQEQNEVIVVMGK